MSAFLSRPGASRRGLSVAAAGGMVAASLAVVAVAAPAQAAPVEVQILGTNDYHGRLLANGSEAGAAQFAGAVAQLRSENPNTVFAAGGDLIGASTFESFIQKDKPTIDALNAAGLDVSAAGNHEFDAGYADLTDRVMAPYDAAGNPLGGAEWQYLAANVRKVSDDSYALPDVAASPGTSDGATWTADLGGVTVGFIGAVTEELPTLVSPGGIGQIKVNSIVDETNLAADALTAAGADLVVMLVHEGAESQELASAEDTSTAFGQIVAGVDGDVDAIVSGHTHLAYNHTINGRPVVSAGQYGTNLNRLVFSVDPVTGDVSVVSQDIVAAAGVALTDPTATAVRDEVAGIVSAAQATADDLGGEVVGKIAGPFMRAARPVAAPTDNPENRGGESTLGNLVAEVQRHATAAPESGSAQIAFMNPGGLRANMTGLGSDAFPRDLTYKQAANVQPFANTLINKQMTGASIKKVLEQQWQRDSSGNVPSRPFLRLGVSEGFEYTYDPARPEGDRITRMWLNGAVVEPATQYSVTMNSFLATGGDNFRAFTEGTDARDTGKIDLAAMVDYMAAYETDALPVDSSQRAVGISFPAGAPSVYRPTDTLTFDVSSLAMTGAGDVQDESLTVRLGEREIGTATVDNTVATGATDDEAGQATVSVKVPAFSGAAPALTLVGDTTGTTVTVPVTLTATKATAKVKVAVTPKKIVRKRTRAKVAVTVTAPAKVTGKVTLRVKGIKRVFTGKVNAKGKVVFTLPKFKKAGKYKATVRYLGSATVKAASKTVTIRVRR